MPSIIPYKHLHGIQIILYKAGDPNDAIEICSSRQAGGTVYFPAARGKKRLGVTGFLYLFKKSKANRWHSSGIFTLHT